MSVEIKTSGSIFTDIHVSGIVNPVNTRGAAGRGLAKEFKIRFPDNCRAYKNACSYGVCGIGRVFTYEVPGENKYIFNLATKDDWSKPSKYSYITSGLESLLHQMYFHKVLSVAIPALGCGLGGLDWGVVQELVKDAFKGEDLLVHLYAPQESQ